MAKEQSDPPSVDVATVPFTPVSLEQRDKEKAQLRAEQQANLPRLLDCLDPTVAKSYEDRKPLYEWMVKTRLFRSAVGKQPARMEDVEKAVVAQTENDAWAMFCDAIGEWPSRRGCRPTITRLKRRTLRDSSEQESQ